MYIAQKLKKSHVTAYLLYMFQVEDILRAYHLDLDKIREQYLPRFQYTEAQMQEVSQWYDYLINMMKEEGVHQSGHLQIVKNTLTLVCERHLELLHDENQGLYKETYYKALPAIVDLRAHGAKHEAHEIENCLEAVYGSTLLRMKEQTVGEGTQKALKPIAQLLELLSQLYTNE